jgi:hypothetical protein
MEEEGGARMEFFLEVHSSYEASRTLKFIPVVVV